MLLVKIARLHIVLVFHPPLRCERYKNPVEQQQQSGVHETRTPRASALTQQPQQQLRRSVRLDGII